jgi:hypothetical protein
MGLKRRKAKRVTKTLKRKFPNTIRFFQVLPPTPPSIVLMVVPVCEPNIMAAAIGKDIAPT